MHYSMNSARGMFLYHWTFSWTGTTSAIAKPQENIVANHASKVSEYMTKYLKKRYKINSAQKNYEFRSSGFLFIVSKLTAWKLRNQ